MTPVRLEPQPLGLEPSTLPLSHCAPRFAVNYHYIFTSGKRITVCSAFHRQVSLAVVNHISDVHWILSGCKNLVQWRSENAEKVTHIKGRLLDQALILFNCIPFQNGSFS